MTPLREQREAAVKAAREIAEKAKGEGRSFTDDERTQLKGYEDQVAEIDRKQADADLVQSIDQMVKDSGGQPGPDGPQAKTLGEHFVKQVGERLAQAKGGRFSLSAPEFKAAGDTHTIDGDWPNTQVDRTVVQQPRPQLTIANLLGSGTMQAGALTYFVEGAREGNFSTVAEAGAKPQLHYNYSTVTDALSKIAGFIKVSDEMVEDFDFIMSEINGRLLYDLGRIEEAQLLNGNGTAPNLQGIMNRTGVQTMGASSDLMAGNLDAVFKAITAVQTGSGLPADGVVVNPADYQTFRLSKDGNNQYYAGGPFTGAYGNGGGLETQPGLWGRRTVVTTAIDAGTVLVGAFAQGGTVYRKGGVRVESTNSNEDDFTHNMVTIRAEERLALAVRRPQAFVKLTLGTDDGSTTTE